MSYKNQNVFHTSSPEQLNLIFKYIPAAVAMFDNDMRYLAVSDRWLEDYNIDENIIGVCHYDIFPNIPDTWKEAHRKGLRGETVGHNHDEFYSKVGKKEWLSWEIKPWYDELHLIGGIIIYTRIITDTIELEVKKAKKEIIIKTQALKESEQRFRMIADDAPAFLFISGENAEVEFLNKTWLNFTGMSFEDAKGRAWVEVTHPEDLHLVSDTYLEAYKQRKPYAFEIRQKGKDGVYRWILWRGVPRFLPSGEYIGFMGFGFDITERKHAEESLKESEEKFRGLADNINQLVWMANPDGWITWYNKSWYDYTGTTMEQMEGWGWQSVHDPNHLAKALEEWKKVISSGKAGELIFPIKGADGVFRTFLTRMVPIKDDDGNITRWFGTNTDISELEKKNQELVKINKDLDNFIYTASHDLKAPISNIEGLILSLPEYVSTETNEKEDFQQIMNLVHTSITRFKNVIQDLTDISQVQRNITEEETDVNICSITDEIKTALVIEIQNTKAEINEYLDSCPVVRFSKRNLRSILYNLISNAIKYRSPERSPVINLRTDRTADGIILSVEDNGLGIEPAKIKHMFAMFKRLHDHVEGTGIGLYIVKRIVENNGGKIEVESELGKGTRFRIFFNKA